MKCHRFFCLLVLITGHYLLATSAQAQVPIMINYQGRLLSGTNLVNGNVGLSLRLWASPSGGTLLYEDSNLVAVADGLYSTFIGDDTTFGSLVGALANSAVYVEVAVNNVALTPRERLASVGYSLATRGLSVDSFNSAVVNPGNNSISQFSGSSTIAGGDGNEIQADSPYSFMGGGFQNSIQEDANHAVLGGGNVNSIQIDADFSVLGGGEANSVQRESTHSFVGGGYGNTIRTNASSSVLVGGYGNSVQNDADFCFLGGGNFNNILDSAYYSFLGGGIQNVIQPTANYCFLGGGYQNIIQTNASASVLGGGQGNIIGAFASHSVIPGGQFCEIGPDASHSFAAGTRAKAYSSGTFVWADNATNNFASSLPNQFLIRASGGVGIGTATPLFPLDVNGGIQAPSVILGDNLNGAIELGPLFAPFNTATPFLDFHYATGGIQDWNVRLINNASNRLECTGNFFALSLTPTSDRNAKENFSEIDANEILAKIEAMPVTRWSFKTEQGVQHIGPMAQDFHAAFGLGSTDKGITTVDADGITLAAIQELVRQNKAQQLEIKELQDRLNALAP